MLSKFVSISVLDANFLNLENDLLALKTNGIEHIHLDVMDTTFVKNISFGPAIINKITRYGFIVELHMMTTNSITILNQIHLDCIDMVIAHIDARDYDQVKEYCKERNKRFCVAFSPDTEINVEDISDVDTVLIMGVYPGFGGQKLIDKSIEKVSYLSKLGKFVGIDGGVNLHALEKLDSATFVVIGSSYFNSDNKKKYYEDCSVLFVSKK